MFEHVAPSASGMENSSHGVHLKIPASPAGGRNDCNLRRAKKETNRVNAMRKECMGGLQISLSAGEVVEK